MSTMEATYHELKIDLPFYDAVASGEKTFEVRFNDRGYQKGDTLALRAWRGTCYASDRPALFRKVAYVYSGLGITPGYVVLGLGSVPRG